MTIEIRRTVRSDGLWEELWIDGVRCVSFPTQEGEHRPRPGLNGNSVAHCLCLAMNRAGLPATYKYVDTRI